jgi:thiol:disulfide interchange protein DsbC
MAIRVLGAVALFALAAIIAGVAINDANSERALSAERQRRLGAVEWESLPLEWAITTVRGTGRRKIAIFSDPNCPYCRRLEETVAKLDDITVHILPYAILGPASEAQAKSVWCSADRAKAWNDLMFRRAAPSSPPACDAPIEKLIAYGYSIRAAATPTWFLESGERHTGAPPLAELQSRLDAASLAKR